MEKIKVIVTLLALIIVAAFAWFKEYDLAKLSYTMAATLVVFYILGGLVERAVKKVSRAQKQLDEELQTDSAPVKNSRDNEVVQVQPHSTKK